MVEWQEQFKNLLRTHVRKGYLRDSRVLKILGELPIDRIFDELQLKRFVYHDSPALFYYKSEKKVRTCSAPHMISMMTSMLELSPEDNVLILGSKGGVIEGVIANIVKEVYILEHNPDVAILTEEAFIKMGIKNIWVRQQNPILGLPEKKLFDKIIITGAVPYVPYILLSQLKKNGIMVVPLMLNHPQMQAIFKFINYRDNRTEFGDEIITKKKELDALVEPDAPIEMINYGGVIFSPLVYNNPPPKDNRDISLKTIIEHAEKYNKPALLQMNRFFEDFNQLPLLEINNIIFTHSQEINQKIPLTHDNNYINNIKLEPLSLTIYISNPEHAHVKLTVQYTNLKKIPVEQVYHKKIFEINEELEEIELLTNISLDQLNNFGSGSISMDISLISMQGFHITEASPVIHILKQESEESSSENVSKGNEWDLTIEYINN